MVVPNDESKTSDQSKSNCTSRRRMHEETSQEDLKSKKRKVSEKPIKNVNIGCNIKQYGGFAAQTYVDDGANMTQKTSRSTTNVSNSSLRRQSSEESDGSEQSTSSDSESNTCEPLNSSAESNNDGTEHSDCIAVDDEIPSTSGLQSRTVVDGGPNTPDSQEKPAESFDVETALLPYVPQGTTNQEEEQQPNTPRKEPKPGVSQPKDFETFAGEGPLTRGWHGSSKPHILMKTAEVEAHRNDPDKSSEALEKALIQLKRHSRPSSEDFLKHAETCKEKRNYFRAFMFQLFSAYKLVLESKYCKNLSKTIFEMAMLVKQKMLTEDQARTEFSNGAHYKQIAKIAVPFLASAYEEGYGDNTEGDFKSRSKAYALRWIAELFLDIEDYTNAAGYAKKGKEVVENILSRQERRQLQTYAHLLDSLGFANHKLGKNQDEALQLLQQALEVERVAKDYKPEQKREEAIKYTKQRIKMVAQTIKAKQERERQPV